MPSVSIFAAKSQSYGTIFSIFYRFLLYQRPSVAPHLHASPLHSLPLLKEYLEDERLSLTQIAYRMNFASLSYFSRYCTKHLGQSPSEYRHSLQPK